MERALAYAYLSYEKRSIIYQLHKLKKFVYCFQPSAEKPVMTPCVIGPCRNCVVKVLQSESGYATQSSQLLRGGEASLPPSLDLVGREA